MFLGEYYLVGRLLTISHDGNSVYSLGHKISYSAPCYCTPSVEFLCSDDMDDPVSVLLSCRKVDKRIKTHHSYPAVVFDHTIEHIRGLL